MIILEGPDGSGKSTLAGRLAEVIQHRGPPGSDDLFREMQRALQADAYAVHDRLFHGELVYGPVLRGRSRLTPYQARYLEYTAATYGALVVWCDADPADLQRRGDPIYQTVLPEELRRRYDEVRRWSRLPFVCYNSSLERVDDVVKIVNNLAGGRDWPHRGVGTQSPVAVLVGEAWPGRWPAPDDAAWQTEPYAQARPFDGSPSGRLLLSALDATNWGPGTLYLTNGRKQWTRNSIRALRLEVESLVGEPPLIALGKEAQRELRVAGLVSRVAAVVDHPQWVNRFHREKSEAYAEQLDGAIRGSVKEIP